MQSLQELIDATPEGGILQLGEASYKENIVISKNIKIVGLFVKKDNHNLDEGIKTHIEGKLTINAPSPVFENCYFDFQDSTCIIEKGICPKFFKCFFCGNELIFDIKGENTNPSFTICHFCGDEDNAGIVFSGGAQGSLDECFSNPFCGVLIKGNGTNPKFCNCQFSCLREYALKIESGAQGCFENSHFCCEYDDVDSTNVD